MGSSEETREMHILCNCCAFPEASSDQEGGGETDRLLSNGDNEQNAGSSTSGARGPAWTRRSIDVLTVHYCTTRHQEKMLISLHDCGQ